MGARAWVIVVALSWGAQAQAQGWMHWPTTREVASVRPLTQGFYGDYIGYCGGRGACGTHNGYDYGVPAGTPLYAVAPGVVEAVHTTDDRSAEYGRGGLWVEVRHDGETVPGLGERFQVAYLHMSQIYVAPGDRVDTSSVLGLSGATGGVGAHLHLHVSRDGSFCASPVDPGCPDRIEGSVIPGFYDAPGCQSVCEAVPVLWAQPARYGGEPWEGGEVPDPCGGLDYAGRCDGDVISWCEGGLQVVDCAATGRVCAWQDDEVGNNCLDCARLGEPKCDGARHLSCASGALVATRCDALGQRCEPGGCVSDAPPDAGGDEAGDAPTDALTDTPTDAAGDAPADAPAVEDAPQDAPEVDARTDAPEDAGESAPRAKTKQACQQGATAWGASPWAWWGAWGRRRAR